MLVVCNNVMSTNALKWRILHEDLLNERRRSAGYARDRMKLLLISERIECSPQMMKMLKSDLVHTVKKYVTIEETKVKIQISQEPPVLMAYIPVLTKKDR